LNVPPARSSPPSAGSGSPSLQLDITSPPNKSRKDLIPHKKSFVQAPHAAQRGTSEESEEDDVVELQLPKAASKKIRAKKTAESEDDKEADPDYNPDESEEIEEEESSEGTDSASSSSSESSTRSSDSSSKRKKPSSSKSEKSEKSKKRKRKSGGGSRKTTTAAREKSLEAKAQTREEQMQVSETIQKEVLEKEQESKGFTYLDVEQRALELKRDHFVGVKEVFVPRMYRAPQSMQIREYMTEHALSLAAKLEENRFPDLPDPYVVPVFLTDQGKENVSHLTSKYIDQFWENRKNWQHFNNKTHFDALAGGLYDQGHVKENTEMSWPTLETRRKFPASKHDIIYYLVVGGNHGIGAIKLFLEKKGKTVWHPNLLFRTSKLYVDLTDDKARAVGRLSADAAENVWGTDVFSKVRSFFFLTFSIFRPFCLILNMITTMILVIGTIPTFFFCFDLFNFFSFRIHVFQIHKKKVGIVPTTAITFVIHFTSNFSSFFMLILFLSQKNKSE